MQAIFLFVKERVASESVAACTREETGRDVLLGDMVTAGIECINGSATYLMTTGMSKSQARIVLSSDVVTKRRFSSTNVIVLTGPRCWSYSCVVSPVVESHCTIFLSDIPARKMCCFSGSGWKATQ